MSLDDFLLDILVDPLDKGELWYLEDEAVLYNPRRAVAYPIDEGIPVLLVDEAVPVDEATQARYAAASRRVTGAGSGTDR